MKNTPVGVRAFYVRPLMNRVDLFRDFNTTKPGTLSEFYSKWNRYLDVLRMSYSGPEKGFFVGTSNRGLLRTKRVKVL